jgi:hypothetical protein
MTDDRLRELSRFYNEIEKTAGLKSFLRECSSFGIVSGSKKCEIPSGLQYRVLTLVDDYYKELKEQQEEL